MSRFTRPLIAAAAVILFALIVGCGSTGTVEPTSVKPPVKMPGGMGITAGQSGTGTTSGASTGY